MESRFARSIRNAWMNASVQHPSIRARPPTIYLFVHRVLSRSALRYFLHAECQSRLLPGVNSRQETQLRLLTTQLYAISLTRPWSLVKIKLFTSRLRLTNFLFHLKKNNLNKRNFSNEGVLTEKSTKFFGGIIYLCWYETFENIKLVIIIL